MKFVTAPFINPFDHLATVQQNSGHYNEAEHRQPSAAKNTLIQWDHWLTWPNNHLICGAIQYNRILTIIKQKSLGTPNMFCLTVFIELEFDDSRILLITDRTNCREYLFFTKIQIIYSSLE